MDIKKQRFTNIQKSDLIKQRQWATQQDTFSDTKNAQQIAASAAEKNKHRLQGCSKIPKSKSGASRNIIETSW